MATIAVIDDSKLARTFASAVLRRAGHDIVEVEPIDLEAVIAVLRELKPHLILVDHHMPGCEGPSVVAACSRDQELMGTKVIMLTAHHEEGLEQRMEELGACGVLFKPIHGPDLLAAVTKACPID